MVGQAERGVVTSSPVGSVGRHSTRHSVRKSLAKAQCMSVIINNRSSHIHTNCRVPCAVRGRCAARIPKGVADTVRICRFSAQALT